MARENVEVLSNRGNTSRRKRVVGALGLATATLLSAGLAEANGKSRGPYTPRVEVAFQSMEEPVKASYLDKQIRTMELSDTFDSAIDTQGFMLGYDLLGIKNRLGPDEIAVLSQKAVGYDGERIVDRVVVTSREFGGPHGESTGEDEPSAQERMLAQYLAMVDSLGERGFPKSDKLHLTFGFGVSAGSTIDSHPLRIKGAHLGIVPLGSNFLSEKVHSIVEIATYRFEKDGSITPLERKEGEVQIIENTYCGKGIPEKITSEIKLTPEQNAIACGMLEKYGKFISDDNRILLDSVTDINRTSDSHSARAESLTLTYPYISNDQLKPERFYATALHEAFHDAYAQLAQDSPLYESAKRTYDGMVRAMEYRLPSTKERGDHDERTDEVEKVWAAITENTYLGDDGGHPWDNPTEMLSSTVTVLAYHPDEFLGRYDQLDRNQREAIAQVVNVAVGLIKHAGYAPSDIIPQYGKIRQQLGTIQ